MLSSLSHARQRQVARHRRVGELLPGPALANLFLTRLRGCGAPHHITPHPPHPPHRILPHATPSRNRKRKARRLRRARHRAALTDARNQLRTGAVVSYVWCARGQLGTGSVAACTHGVPAATVQESSSFNSGGARGWKPEGELDVLPVALAIVVHGDWSAWAKQER